MRVPLSRKIATTHIRRRTSTASGYHVRTAFFPECRRDLEWLSILLVGNKDLVDTCLASASTLATTQHRVFESWIESSARQAMIRAAVLIQHARIVELSLAYERKQCPHAEHLALEPRLITLLRARAGELVDRLDPLSRVALVACGIEDYPATRAALLVGVSRAALRAAYCAGLESLSIIGSERRSCA